MSILQSQYALLKSTLASRPGRADLWAHARLDFRRCIKVGWLSFLASIGDVSREELGWIGTPVEEFLYYLETTRFEKAYKIPTVLTFLADGGIRTRVSLKGIAHSFMEFYRGDELRQSDFCNKCNRDWERWGEDEFADLALRNPITYLSSEFFHYDGNSQTYSLDKRLEPYLTSALAAHVRDIMGYREMKYFKNGKRSADLAAEAAVTYEE